MYILSGRSWGGLMLVRCRRRWTSSHRASFGWRFAFVEILGGPCDSSYYVLCLPSTERERHVALLLTAHFSVRCPCVHLSCKPSNTRRWPNFMLLLAHRLRRWAKSSPVLGYCVVFDATRNVGQRHRRRAKINPGPMSQHSVEGLFIERKAV